MESRTKSSNKITCNLDLNGKPLGKYDLFVKNLDDQESTLARGFSVTDADACGQGGGASITVFAGLMGLLSLAGFGIRRKRA